MKRTILIAALTVTIGIYAYNTPLFRSIFVSDAFFADIIQIPFDVLNKDETVSIPLRYKYDTYYELEIVVPGRELSDAYATGKGRLLYRFISNGKTLATGKTRQVGRHNWGGDDAVSRLAIMTFDLPFEGESDDLILELRVIEPFAFMSKYKGSLSIAVSPAYSPKVGNMHEDLRIDQSE